MTPPPNSSSPSSAVLVVDDNREVLTAIRLLLKDHVDAVHTTTDPAALPALLRETSYDAVLLDMNFSQGASSGQEGFHWLARIRQADPDAVVLMITAYGDIDRAVRAMKEGAADFIVKPWQNETLLAAVRGAARLRQSRRVAGQRAAGAGTPPAARHGAEAPDTAGAAERFGSMIGASPAMRRVFETIEKVAATDANVLVLGEHGTGKELVARSLHDRSRRAARPFVSVDLGALSENLFESELFGHVRGAFTGADRDRAGRFEEAAGGTLFLDEIGNIPPPLQRKLLTAIERREVSRVGSVEKIPVDLRLVSATNLPIYEMARRGGAEGFREDLLYRINTVEIRLPPLRERKADIPLLARHYLRVHAERYGRPAHDLGPAALQALAAYHWPGNVRELKHTLERAVILSDAAVLQPSDFHFSAPPEDHADAGLDSGLDPGNLDLEAIEHAAIRKALSKHGGNISRAAEELGLTRRSLYRRIEKYGL